MNNWLGLIISVGYIFAIIGVAEGLRRWRGFSSDFTRKVIHIGVGMMSWALHLLFDSPWYFIGACGAFAILNLLDWRYGIVASMASSDRSNLGTVYFPLAAGVVAYYFWEQPPLMVSALMPLTWGDGLAPVIGRNFGRRTYKVYNTVRTVEGSAGFFVACLIATWLALWALSGLPAISALNAFPPALIVALVTTLIEGVTILGLDNLTITFGAALILNLWPF